MSARGEVYYLEEIAARQTAAERAARVREFIAGSNPEIIADLFTEIKRAIIECEANEAVAAARYYRSVSAIINDIESDLCS